MIQAATTTALPPSEVFTAWLNWWLQSQYAATGEWPLPPAPAPASSSRTHNGNTAQRSFTPPPHMPSADVRPGHSDYRAEWPGAGGVGVEYESYYSQPPMPGIARPVGVLPVEEKPHTPSRTGFDYLESEYGVMAGELLKKTAITGIAMVNCQKVMALILAWCCFSVFRFEKRGRKGRWMTLGLDRISRELRLTNKTTLETLKLLQTAGLVIVTRAGLSLGQGDKAQVLISEEEIGWLREDFARLTDEEGGGPHGYLNPRFLQSNVIKSYPSRKGLQLFGGNSFYFLKEDVDTTPLSPFNPFVSLKKEVRNSQGQAKRTSPAIPILEKDVKRPVDRTKTDVVKGLHSLKKHGKGPSATEKRALQAEKGRDRTSPAGENVLQRPHDMNHDLNDMNDSYPTPAEKAKFKPYKELSEGEQTAIGLLKSAHKIFPDLAGANITAFNPIIAWKVAQEQPLEKIEWAIQKALYDWTSFTANPKSKNRPRSSAALIMHNLKSGEGYELMAELTAENLADMDQRAAEYRKKKGQKSAEKEANREKGSTGHDRGTFGNEPEPKPGSRSDLGGNRKAAKGQTFGMGQEQSLAGDDENYTTLLTDPRYNGDGINGFKSLPDRRTKAELEAI
jgi:hypothetical protein